MNRRSLLFVALVLVAGCGDSTEFPMVIHWPNTRAPWGWTDGPTIACTLDDWPSHSVLVATNEHVTSPNGEHVMLVTIGSAVIVEEAQIWAERCGYGQLSRTVE